MTSTLQTITVYLFTLLAGGVYALRHPDTIYVATAAVLLMGLFLLLLVLKRFGAPLLKNLPIFFVFWALLYVVLPLGIDPSAAAKDLFRIRMPQVQALLLRPDLRRWWYFLLAVLALMVILRNLLKKHSGPMLLVLYHGAAMVATGGLALVLAGPVLLQVPGSAAVFLRGPLLFGGLLLFENLRCLQKHTSTSRLTPLVWFSLLCGLVLRLYGPAALPRMAALLTPEELFWPFALLGIFLLVVSAAKDKSETADDTVEPVYTAFCLPLLIWLIYFAFFCGLPQYRNWYVLAFGVPFVHLFFESFTARDREDLGDGQFAEWLLSDHFFGPLLLWLISIPILLALSKVANSRPEYLLLLVALFLARYLCHRLTPKEQQPLVMRCFRGIAGMLLLAGLGLPPGVLTVTGRPLLVLLLSAAFWCILCIMVQRVCSDKSAVYESEYVLLNKIHYFLPHLLTIIALLLLLF